MSGCRSPGTIPDGNPAILVDRGSSGPSAMFPSVAAAGSRLVSHPNMHARLGSTVELEQRPYGPESTREEREAIADRVSVVDDRILLIHEVPVQSPFSVKLMFDRFQALAHDWDRFAYVVDLTEAKRPNPETRAALKAQILWHQPARHTSRGRGRGQSADARDGAAICVRHGVDEREYSRDSRRGDRGGPACHGQVTARPIAS